MDPYTRFLVVFLSVWVVLGQIVFGFVQFRCLTLTFETEHNGAKKGILLTKLVFPDVGILFKQNGATLWTTQTCAFYFMLLGADCKKCQASTDTRNAWIIGGACGNI